MTNREKEAKYTELMGKYDLFVMFDGKSEFIGEDFADLFYYGHGRESDRRLGYADPDTKTVVKLPETFLKGVSLIAQESDTDVTQVVNDLEFILQFLAGA